MRIRLMGEWGQRRGRPHGLSRWRSCTQRRLHLKLGNRRLLLRLLLLLLLLL